MRIIRDGGKYEILSPGEYSQDPRIIELAGRTCYKSQRSEITEESSAKFINMLRDRQHESVLEHKIFVFEISPRSMEVEEFSPQDTNLYPIITSQIAEAMNDVKGLYWSVTGKGTYHISLNLRSLRDWLRTQPGSLCDAIALYVDQQHPNLIEDIFDRYECKQEFWWGNCNFRLVSGAEIQTWPREIQLLHNYMTVRFTDISIGMTRESNRHRAFSISERSTRYVDESGGNFIIPPHKNTSEHVETIYDDDQNKYAMTIYNKACQSIDTYKVLREKNDWKKQDARQFLPLGINTEVVYTGNLKAWKNFFKLRTHKSCHWEIKHISRQLCFETKNIFPGVFDDIKWD